MYTRAEQETHIVWDEEEKVAHIYTSSPVSMRRLDNFCTQYPDVYNNIWQEFDKDGRRTAAKYVVDSRYIKYGRPASEAQKERGKMLGKLHGFKTKEVAPLESIDGDTTGAESALE